MTTSHPPNPSSVHDLGPSAEAMPETAASVSAVVASGVTVAGAFGQGSADAPRDSFYAALGALVLPAISAALDRDICTGCGASCVANYSCGGC